jgi:hypothetical protein
MPQRFAGVDIPDTGNACLIEQEILQRSGGSGEQLAEMRGTKCVRKSVGTQCFESRAFFDGVPSMNAAEMAAVRKAENALAEFECHINVNAIFGLVGPLKKFFCIGEPDQLAIEAEVQGEQASIQDQKNVFASAIHALNVAARGELSHTCCGLRFHGDGMQDVDAADALPLY